MAAYRNCKAADRFIRLAICITVIAGCSAGGTHPPAQYKTAIERGTAPQETDGITGNAATRPAASDLADQMQVWNGDYPVSELDRFPEGQRHGPVGFIDNAATFTNLWQAFKPGEGVPDIDFERELILFARNTHFYNRIAIARINLVDGVAEIVAMETLSALPIEDKVALSLAKATRHGIRAVLTPRGAVALSGQSGSRTYVFECASGYHFVASIAEAKAWLFLPDKTVSLPRLSSDAPLTYDDGAIRLRVAEEKAEIDTGDGKVLTCTNNGIKAIWEDAKLRGVDFRATGNEPGWHLEITAGGNIIFTTDYGNAVFSFTTPPPRTDNQARTTAYKVLEQGHSLTVHLEGRQCQDTMSDESFDTTVTVTLDGQTYQGCGMALH